MEGMKYPSALKDIVQFGEYHCDLFQHFDIELDCGFFSVIALCNVIVFALFACHITVGTNTSK